ncbi:hypothetical protein BC629DRAFT_1437286 [Irpex lacteus]|nr:hypothetical protein BC629DRAFT_1437286 [Irpex lacteus]
MTSTHLYRLYFEGDYSRVPDYRLSFGGPRLEVSSMSGRAQMSREMAILAYFSVRTCYTRRHDLCRTISRVIRDNSSGIEDTMFELPSHYNCPVGTNLCNTERFTRIGLIEEICLRCALRLLPVPSTFHPSRLDQRQPSSHVEHPDGRMIRGGQY